MNKVGHCLRIYIITSFCFSQLYKEIELCSKITKVIQFDRDESCMIGYGETQFLLPSCLFHGDWSKYCSEVKWCQVMWVSCYCLSHNDFLWLVSELNCHFPLLCTDPSVMFYVTKPPTPLSYLPPLLFSPRLLLLQVSPFQLWRRTECSSFTSPMWGRVDWPSPKVHCISFSANNS